MADQPLKDIPHAAAMSLGICDSCTAIHFNLLDERGDVFATASLPAVNWGPFRHQFEALAVEALRRTPMPKGRQ